MHSEHCKQAVSQYLSDLLLAPWLAAAGLWWVEHCFLQFISDAA